MVKSALITGITGQDGSYLAELLLEKGYEVFGIARETSASRTERLRTFRDKIHLMKGDMLDQKSLERAVKRSHPDEVYNLASPSFIGGSFKEPTLFGEVSGLGALRIMEAVRAQAPDSRVYLACSSEMFAGTSISPQNESTDFRPRSPYGVAKVFCYWAGVSYRESHGMFIGNGVTYNHESPRRGREFVTRKITSGVARIRYGLQNTIELGNLNSKRDWGYAPEYVDAMWRILQQKQPEDFVISTGETHTVREWLEESCRVAGIEDPEKIVSVKTENIRPSDSVHLRGDPSKAKQKLGWSAQTRFKGLVRLMVEADLELAEKEAKEK